MMCPDNRSTPGHCTELATTEESKTGQPGLGLCDGAGPVRSLILN